MRHPGGPLICLCKLTDCSLFTAAQSAQLCTETDKTSAIKEITFRLANPEFLSGKATTSFIQRNPQLITGAGGGGKAIPDSSKLLEYLAELVRRVNPQACL